MKVTVETIDPKRASAILAKSEGQRQRTLSQMRVEKLAHAIEAGQWKITHQGIALDVDGVLVDGQHRLHAIVRAGLPVEMSVARGVDPEAFDVIDTGFARTPAAALQIAGYPNSTVLAAAARHVLAYDIVAGTTNSFGDAARALTSRDILDLVESERGSRLLAVGGPAEHVSHALGRYGSKTWMTAVMLVISEGPVGAATIENFWDSISSGANLATDSPMLIFRRWMSMDTGYSRAPHGQRTPLAMAITIKAFNRYSSGQPSALLAFRIGIERYPVVHPVGTDPESGQ